MVQIYCQVSDLAAALPGMYDPAYPPVQLPRQSTFYLLCAGKAVCSVAWQHDNAGWWIGIECRGNPMSIVTVRLFGLAFECRSMISAKTARGSSCEKQ